ncbi:COMMD6 isoform 5 [Pongo abelii]|uniref:COMMD6 isoform 5 n=1 Tax=Pongo abelii TaxID=9601 RepID=A0A2J8WU21_PONAB|nr:COMMD6 isoform 5 [Pongo abelii]
MEASSEPRLDAKSEVSSNLEGQRAARLWSKKDVSLNCVSASVSGHQPACRFSVETGYGCELRHLQIS